MEEFEIKRLSMIDGRKQAIHNLKSFFTADYIKPYSIDMRPITLEHKEQGCLLILYQIDYNFRMMLFNLNIENPQKIENCKEYVCAQALFLGKHQFSNPPLFVLYEDHQSFQLIIDTDKPLDQELGLIQNQSSFQETLDNKIEKIYWTPLRQGLVVVYKMMDQNLLQFSANRRKENSPLDFQIMKGGAVQFAIEENEIIFDVVWKMESEIININICAVVCWNTIYLLTDEFQLIHTINLNNLVKNSPITKAFWFGPALIYSSINGVYYSTISGGNYQLFGFENYNMKNNVIGVMADRIVLAEAPQLMRIKSKNNSFIEIKFRDFNYSELLINGYLAIKDIFKNFQLDKKLIFYLIDAFESNSFSQNLITELNKHQLYDFSHVICSNQINNAQFTLHDQITLIKQLGNVTELFEKLFPQKNFTNSGDLKEIIKEIQQNPQFCYHKTILQEFSELFKKYGELSLALKLELIFVIFYQQMQ